MQTGEILYILKKYVEHGFVRLNGTYLLRQNRSNGNLQAGKRTVRSIYLNLYDAFVKTNSYAIHQIARDFVLVSRSSLSAYKNVRILF